VNLRTLSLEERIAEGTNAWELFDIVDLPLAALALAAVALPPARAVGWGPRS